MSVGNKSVPIPLPTRQQVATDLRETLKRGKPTLYLSSMNDLPHGVFYADGEERFLANGANWDLIKFRRTGKNNPDDGEWILFATSSAVVNWP